MRKYFEWILRNRLMVLLAIGLATTALGLQTRNLKVIIDTNALVPQSHPYIAATNKIERIFGSRYVIEIGLSPKQGDIYQPAVLQQVKDITDELYETPGVVRSKLLSLAAQRAKDIAGNADGLQVQRMLDKVPNTPEALAALRTAVARNPVYQSVVVSGDARTTAIIVEFKEDAAGFSDMVSRVQPIVDRARQRDPSIDIRMSGLPVFLAHLEQFSQRMGFLFPLAILIVGLVHLEAFRTVQGLLLPLVTALLAVIWGLGIMGLFGVPMDVFNAATPILILAVAAGHAVQLLKRYYEDYSRLRQSSAMSPREANRLAVIESLGTVGPVTIAAGLIATLGFFSLMVFEVRSVRTFGLFTGVGIASAVIIEMTFMPALRSLLKPPPERVRDGGREARIWNAITAFATWLVVEGRGALYVTCALILGVALAGMSKVHVDDSTKSFFSTGLDFRQDDAILNQQLAGTNTLYVLVEGQSDDAIKDPAVLKAMDETQRFMEAQPGVGKTVSIVDFIKRMNQAMHADDPAYFKVPDDRALISQYLLLYSMSGDPGDFDAYVDNGYRRGNITALLKTDSSAYIADLMPKLQAEVADRFGKDVSVSFGGSVPQTAALSEVIIHSKITNILQVCAVVFLVSALVLRSLLAGALVLVPLILAVVANFGLMGLFGIPLNIPTSLCSAMAVGIGADYSIYMIFRLREQMRGASDESVAIAEVIRTAGKAVLFVASAVACGYGVLLFSPGFHVHQWMALLIAVSMLVSAVSALLLVPALVVSFRPRFIFSGQERPAAMSATPAVLAIGALLLVGFAARQPVLADEGLTATEIMKRTFMVSKVVDSTFDATITLINSSNEQRVRKTIGATKLEDNGVDAMRMTRFLAPDDVRGTVSLLVEHSDADDGMWIYLPALKKVRRMVSSNKKESFVGTDFSYGDVIGHRVDQWQHTRKPDEVVDGQDCYVIESTPASAEVRDDSGYARRVSWISKSSFVSVKGRYYDTSGVLLKETTSSDVRQVDASANRWQPMKMEADNLQTGHKTVITFENYKVNQGVSTDVFTTRSLEQMS